MARNSKARSHYDPACLPLVEELALLGSTDVRIAAVFDCHPDDFCRWKVRYPELGEALKKGRDIADSKVAASLYKRACGFSYTEIKREADGKVVQTRKHMPPDTGACIYWLNNRQKEYWRQTFHIDDRARAELEQEIQAELDRLAAMETKSLPRTAPASTH